MWSWSASLKRRAVQPSLPYGIVAERSISVSVSETLRVIASSSSVAPPRSATVPLPCSWDQVIAPCPRATVHSPAFPRPGRWHADATCRCLRAEAPPVVAGLNHNALKEFGDSVGCHGGVQGEVASDRDRGISPVDGRLMQSTPQPPISRAAVPRSPHRGLHTGLFDGVDERCAPPLCQATRRRDPAGAFLLRHCGDRGSRPTCP